MFDIWRPKEGTILSYIASHTKPMLKAGSNITATFTTLVTLDKPIKQEKMGEGGGARGGRPRHKSTVNNALYWCWFCVDVQQTRYLK